MEINPWGDVAEAKPVIKEEWTISYKQERPADIGDPWRTEQDIPPTSPAISFQEEYYYNPPENFGEVENSSETVSDGNLTTNASNTSLLNRLSLSPSITSTIATQFQPKLVTSSISIVNKYDVKGVWEGFGCNLGWFANYVGLSSVENQNLICDLFFTDKYVQLLNHNLPGLNLGIVRYNIGGCGEVGDVATIKEKLPANFPWIKRTVGFWKNWDSPDPNSSSFDWTRDQAQRNILRSAIQRGVMNIEFNSYAPPWWMTHEKSSAGGRLQSWNLRDFALYLANVVYKARSEWGVYVKSIAPFNEPSSGWWRYPKDQEGCGIPRDQQRSVIAYLREELDKLGLDDVVISGSDENNVKIAVDTLKDYIKYPAKVHGKWLKEPAIGRMGKVNVHSYNGTNPNRDCKARDLLKSTVAKGTPIWVSEYGDSDASGYELARTIFEDIGHLNPSAWLYWQPTGRNFERELCVIYFFNNQFFKDPTSTWGLLNTECDSANHLSSLSSATFANPIKIHHKFYVYAHFTRFIKPNNLILGANEHNTIVAYDTTMNTLSLVLMTQPDQLRVVRKYELKGFTVKSNTYKVTCTKFDGSLVWEKTECEYVKSGRIELECDGASIYSLLLNDVYL
ncbi:hypothetical protein HK098_003927 [Nowakowskiella sp. JEL0407]|nr:hypothetical protein HK098_003927 [Nowakowskiella sp. JEL0407]